VGDGAHGPKEGDDEGFAILASDWSSKGGSASKASFVLVAKLGKFGKLRVGSQNILT
jgi:hypothetical protein